MTTPAADIVLCTAVRTPISAFGGALKDTSATAIGGGLPVEVPAPTVNRVCGSGARAIASAAVEVVAGQVSAITAGGMESMNRAHYLLPGARWEQRMGDAAMADSLLQDGLNDAVTGRHSGWHTEDLVSRFGISRQDLDR